MNAKSLIASVSFLLAAGAAFAAPEQNEAAQDIATQNATASSLTREQVKADTIAAIKAGQLDRNEAYDDVAYMAPRAKNASVNAQLASKAVKGNTQH